VLGAAVAQVVAVHAGDDDVLAASWRRWFGEFPWGLFVGGRGLPWPTSQNGQRRVQMSPRIMKVAVPLPKHSPMLGQVASSHTVCSWCSRRICFTSLKREALEPALTRIQSGFFSAVSRRHHLDRDAGGFRFALQLDATVAHAWLSS
jgi:hypothetical protein